jgi:serpin B
MLNVLFSVGLLLQNVATPEDAQAVLTANNQFALDLYGQLHGSEGNLFFSPYSVNKTLAMVYAGARGETASEMASVLHFTLGQERQHAAFLEARNLLNAHAGIRNPLIRNRDVELQLAAGLWGQKGCHFRDAYLRLLQECYGAGLRDVDFTATEPALRTINDWVEKQTHDKIRELFKPGVLDAGTRLVLTSAIYFNGAWTHPFDKSQSREETFTTGDSRAVPVRMMKQTETFGYFENNELQGLRMTYEGNRWALLVLLPKKKDGLPELEKTLTAEKLTEWLGQMQQTEVAVSLPKCKMTSAFPLAETLKALGMRKAFSASEADLSGMNDGQEPLYVSAVVHQAFVDVTEEGTEAAAATGAAVATLSAPFLPPSRPEFRADHPFIFAISHVQTGAILFLGRVVTP